MKCIKEFAEGKVEIINIFKSPFFAKFHITINDLINGSNLCFTFVEKN